MDEKKIVCFLKKDKKNISKASDKIEKDIRNSIKIRGVSPYRLIEAVDLVICFPFTSAAFQAIELKKEVIFYDPIGILIEDIEMCRGIRLVKNYKELSKEISKFIDE